MGGCNGSGGEGGGVDEVAVGNIDEEVKVCKEVGPDERDGDVHDDEPPGEGAVTEGESHRLVPIGDDAGAVGSYQMSIGAWTITAMNHGLWEEGSASTRADEEVETCEGIKHKEHISGDRDHRFKRRPHNSFYGHAHVFFTFFGRIPKTSVVITKFCSEVIPPEGGGGRVLLWARARFLGLGPGGGPVGVWRLAQRRCSCVSSGGLEGSSTLSKGPDEVAA